ncbi:stimulator of interferon genes protein homolog [Eurosta solidaginis]|uniref:stimulator of interferon genes protein homolog n=1 Tax=Eurosta solidaginis TaxID=178769 RepID=UPI0035316761
MDAFGDYIDINVHIMFTIYIADIIQRFFKTIVEYFKYKNHNSPENRLWTILGRAYCYNVPSRVLFFFIIVISIYRARFPPLHYLAYMPILWLYHCVNVPHSTLDYATFIRANHGLDSASSMAANYFHGYLKLTLPAYTNNPGIRERIYMYEQRHDVKFALNRLIILVPSQLFIKSKFESPYLEKAEPLPKVYLNRAGVNRPYQNDVYRFTKPINNRFYYMALEGATPILTFFETINFQPTSTKEILQMKREILLKFFKYLKKLVGDWPETEQETELIFYDDYKPNGEKQDIGEMLFNHFKSILLSKESSNSNNTFSTRASQHIESIHD